MFKAFLIILIATLAELIVLTICWPIPVDGLWLPLAMVVALALSACGAAVVELVAKGCEWLARRVVGAQRVQDAVDREPAVDL